MFENWLTEFSVWQIKQFEDGLNFTITWSILNKIDATLVSPEMDWKFLAVNWKSIWSKAIGKFESLWNFVSILDKWTSDPNSHDVFIFGTFSLFAKIQPKQLSLLQIFLFFKFTLVVCFHLILCIVFYKLSCFVAVAKVCESQLYVIGTTLRLHTHFHIVFNFGHYFLLTLFFYKINIHLPFAVIVSSLTSHPFGSRIFISKTLQIKSEFRGTWFIQN